MLQCLGILLLEHQATCVWRGVSLISMGRAGPCRSHVIGGTHVAPCSTPEQEQLMVMWLSWMIKEEEYFER